MNSSINLLLQQAIDNFEQGNFSQTQLLLSNVLKIQPKNFHALHIMGVTLGIENKHEEARDFLMKALKINPNDGYVNFNLAKALSEKGDDLGSIKYHEAAIKFAPKYAEAWLNFGKSFWKLNRYDEALSHYDQAIHLNPNYTEAWSNKGVTFHDLKRYDEALSHYDQAIHLNPNYTEAWSNKGNTLHDLKRYDEALSHYDQAIHLNPNYAEAWFNKGNTLKDLKRFEEALSHYDQAIHLNPNYTDAWSNKGNTLKDLKRFDEALSHYDQAIHLNANYADAWSNKGVTLHDLKRYDEALSHYDQAIHLNPNYAEAWFNKGVTLHNLKSYDEALSHYDQAIHLKPDFFDSYWNKSLALLTLGDFKDGWDLYNYRWKITNADKYRHNDINELQSLDELNNKNILVWHEQGYGDTIQFSRYISKLIDLGANITFEVQKPLLRIFAKHKKLVITSEVENHKKFDFQIPLLSLPKLFNTSINSIPTPSTIQIKPEDISIWRGKLNISDKKLNIGLAISGNPKHKNDSNRSMKLDDISPLLDIGDFFLLQKEINHVDIDNLNKKTDLNFLGGQINDFNDTASIIMNMDLIISVDTSLIHLAGSLNKKSFLMLPWHPDWRWLLDRSESPWYPSVKIFRQKSLGDWHSVIKDIKSELLILAEQ